MELTITVYRERYSCWTEIAQYQSCHVPRVGERIRIPEGYFTVTDVIYDIKGSLQSVELHVEY